MHEVRPGQVIRVNRDGVTKRRYWMLTAHEHEDDLPRTVRTVAELLEDIVKRQIVSDVPLCSLVSGGYQLFSRDCDGAARIRRRTTRPDTFILGRFRVSWCSLRRG